MKKSITQSLIITTLAGTVAFMSSCKKYLDLTSPSTIDQTTAFASASYTNSALIGCYNQLIGDNGYGQRMSLILTQSADDFKTSGAYNPADRRGVSLYGSNADNSEFPSPFAQSYVGAERANICIKGIQNSPLFATSALMKQYYGEALALRAMFYFDLVKNWGDVVAQFIPSADEQVFDVPVTDKKVILDQLIADLGIAENLVPWIRESGFSDTRFTRGAIKGLRARIALFRGGYLLNEATHADERSSNYLDYYKIAMQECADVMARRDEHDLNPVYENIFKSLHSATRFDDKNELMFEIGAFGGNATTDSKIGYYNGIKFNASSSIGGGGGGMLAIPTYFYEFDQLGDCRRDVTIGSWQIDANTQKTPNAFNAMSDAKFRRSWSIVIGGTAQNFGINWPVLRFADILLMYAEADNEVNGAPSGAAKSALQEVRDRAFVGFLSREPAMPTSHDDFFNAIVKERLLEFGGEGLRKYDLIRWKLSATTQQQVQAKLAQLQAGTGAYANVPSYIYYKPSAYLQGTSQAEVAAINLYGGAPNTVLFQPGLGTSSAPSGYTSVSWRASISTTSDVQAFMQYFQEGSREVFPWPTSVLTRNTKLVQKYGY
ncbi:RagB/SusD family nutrient uptake outer membrane protein [Mucilaginibacter yixingensis]|nr:RagB/SusD family nutrient uptake outer membrane protein [Mucilaginibacter yixingensis]